MDFGSGSRSNHEKWQKACNFNMKNNSWCHLILQNNSMGIFQRQKIPRIPELCPKHILHHNCERKKKMHFNNDIFIDFFLLRHLIFHTAQNIVLIPGKNSISYIKILLAVRPVVDHQIGMSLNSKVTVSVNLRFWMNIKHSKMIFLLVKRREFLLEITEEKKKKFISIIWWLSCGVLFIFLLLLFSVVSYPCFSPLFFLIYLFFCKEFRNYDNPVSTYGPI